MPRTDRLAQAFDSGLIAAPPAGEILVIRAASPALAQALDPSRLLFEQSFRPAYDSLVSAGLRATPRASAPAAMVIVTLTRARAENLGNVARALGFLPPGGLLVIDGAKTDGVDSLVKQVATVLPLDGAFAKAHGRVVWHTRSEALSPAISEWAAGAAPSRNAEGFMTMPGVFSPDAADPGSRRLAEALDGRIKGRVADLGAGWGWLAHQALARCPGIVALDLFEAEARALDAARENVSDPRTAFHWADVRTLTKADPPHDAVIANPPFHQGRAAEPDLGAGFIAAAARILKPSGRFLMVANRQLPYEAALDAAFARWEKLTEDRAFKVFAAERPRRSEGLRPRPRA